jgi:hypothetical protein
MAGVAGHAAGVFGGRHLRKVLRFCRVLLMAAAAEIGDIGEFGNVCRRVIRVLRQWTMARFTGHMGMLAGGSGGGLVIVTHDAGVLPGEGYLMLADQVERARPVVTILPKCLGDDDAADNEEDCQNA